MSSAFKIGVLVVSVAISLMVGYHWGATDEREEVLHAPKSIHMLEPNGKQTKKQHVLKVIGIYSPGNDRQRLSDDPETWRIYVRELDLILYLEDIPVKN